MTQGIYDTKMPYGLVKVKELRVSSSTQLTEMTPSSGYCFRVFGVVGGIMTISSLMTQTVRSTLAFGSGHTSVTSAIIWSGRYDQIGDLPGVPIMPIDVKGVQDQKIRLTNGTYSAGLLVNRALIYFIEEAP